MYKCIKCEQKLFNTPTISPSREKFVSVVMRIKMMSKFTELANQIHGLEVANKYEDLTVSGEWLMSAVDALHEASELKAQLKERDWICSSKIPPDKKKHLLLRFASGVISSGKYRYGRLGEPQQDIRDWRCDCSGRFATPTHWMPLPQPPKEKDYE